MHGNWPLLLAVVAGKKEEGKQCPEEVFKRPTAIFFPNRHYTEKNF